MLTNDKEWEWVEQFGEPGVEYLHAMGTDSGKNLFVAGATEGSLFGDKNNPDNVWDRDVYLAKYSASGDQVWAVQFGTGESDAARALGAGRASCTILDRRKRRRRGCTNKKENKPVSDGREREREGTTSGAKQEGSRRQKATLTRQE